MANIVLDILSSPSPTRALTRRRPRARLSPFALAFRVRLDYRSGSGRGQRLRERTHTRRKLPTRRQDLARVLRVRVHVVSGGEREDEQAEVVVARLRGEVECVFEVLSAGDNLLSVSIRK